MLAIDGRLRPVACEQSICHAIKSTLEPRRQQVGPIPIICFFDGQGDDQYSCPDVHAARLGEGIGLAFGRVDLPARRGHAVEYEERRVAALLELARDNARRVLALQLHSLLPLTERAFAERDFAFEDVDEPDSITAWCQMLRKRSTRRRDDRGGGASFVDFDAECTSCRPGLWRGRLRALRCASGRIRAGLLS